MSENCRFACAHAVLACALFMGSGAVATAQDIHVVDVEAVDMVHDPVGGRLIVSVGEAGTSHAGEVIAVDPTTGEIVHFVDVAGPLGAVVVSDDGSTAHVSAAGGISIVRVDLSTWESEPPFEVGSDPFGGGAFLAADIAALPGSSTSILVSRGVDDMTPRHGGVAIYDDGVPRATATPEFSGTHTIELAAPPSTLYGVSANASGVFFRTMRFDDDGIVLDGVTVVGSLRPDTELRSDGQRLYVPEGTVIDPSVPEVVGILAVESGAVSVAPDPANGRVVVLSAGTAGEVVVQSFDSTTFAIEQTLRYNHGATPLGPIVAWGASGVAYRERVGEPGAERIRVVILPDLSEGPPVVRPYRIEEYFPVQFGTSWQYEDQDGKLFRRTLRTQTDMVRGNVVLRFQNTKGKAQVSESQSDWVLDERGLSLGKRAFRHREFVIQGNTFPAYTSVIEYIPPVLICEPNVDLDGALVHSFSSTGTYRLTVHVGKKRGSQKVRYFARHTVTRCAPVLIPGFPEPVECLQIDGEVSASPQFDPGSGFVTQWHFARGIGIVSSVGGAGITGLESQLRQTDLGRHELAIDSVKAGRAKLTKRRPKRSAAISVKLRNLSGRTEVITDAAMLDAFLRVEAESLGDCPAPPAAIHRTTRFPIVIKPGRRKTLRMTIDVDCANDGEKTSKRSPGHEDFRLRATLTPAALDVFVRSAAFPESQPPIEAEALLDVVQK